MHKQWIVRELAMILVLLALYQQWIDREQSEELSLESDDVRFVGHRDRPWAFD